MYAFTICAFARPSQPFLSTTNALRCIPSRRSSSTMSHRSQKNQSAPRPLHWGGRRLEASRPAARSDQAHKTTGPSAITHATHTPSSLTRTVASSSTALPATHTSYPFPHPIPAPSPAQPLLRNHHVTQSLLSSMSPAIPARYYTFPKTPAR